MTDSDGLTWSACFPKSSETYESLAEVSRLLYETRCSYAISFYDDDPSTFEQALDEMWSDASETCKVRSSSPRQELPYLARPVLASLLVQSKCAL